MEKIYKVAGYVKLAKLWERTRGEAIRYHNGYYSNKFKDSPSFRLYKVYIDITGQKETYKRTEMVRLIRDCREGKIDLIATQTKAYLAANTKEFCCLLNLLFSLQYRIDIITEDDDYNINTVVNAENQREALQKMAKDFVTLYPKDYEEWITRLNKNIGKLQEV